MAIKCGHCRDSHKTISEVRSCSHTRTFTEQDERDMQRMEAERDHADTIRDEANKRDYREWLESGPTKQDLAKRVRTLLATRDIPGSEARWAKAMNQYLSGSVEDVTEFGMAAAIERLETFPERKLADQPAEHEGLYRLDGRLYQVVRSRETGRLYAKLVVFPPEGSTKKRPMLSYARGVIYDLTPAHLLPVEEAQEITRKTGWCVFGHFLTDPKSIARGMGPKCFERYPHLAKNAVAT